MLMWQVGKSGDSHCNVVCSIGVRALAILALRGKARTRAMAERHTAAADERDSLCLSSRLDLIESQAKRFCTSISDEVSHLKQISTKAEAANKAAELSKAEANEVAKQAHAAAAAEVQAEKAALDAEKDAMTDLHILPATIELDIGGKRFKTSRTTLTKHKGSFLESMFSGRHVVAAAPDGSFFIDRDPQHFRVILNYLRCGAAITPHDAVAKAEAAEEAAFYGLQGLQRALLAPPLDMEALLGPEIAHMRQLERELRARFVISTADGDAGSRAGTDTLHEGLLSLFDGGADAVGATLMYVPDPRAFPLVLEKQAGVLKRPPVTSDTIKRCTVGSIEHFRTNFNKLHPNILHRLAPVLASGKLLVAGGSVLHALTHGQFLGGGVTSLGDKFGPASDVDLFLHSCTPGEATLLTKEIFDAVATDLERWTISRSRGVLTLVHHEMTEVDRVALPQDRRHISMLETVQVVLRLYDSPAEILLGFDVDCACCGYDGTHVWALPRAVRAIKHGTNILNPLHAWPVRAAYEFRLAKYASRGYSIAVPGLDYGKLDHVRIRNDELRNLSGLARLLRICHHIDFGSISNSALDNGINAPKILMYNNSLGSQFFESLAPEDKMVFQGGGIYDNDDGIVQECGVSIVLPACFPSGVTSWSFGWGNDDGLPQGPFPTIGSIRAEAWAEILDCGPDKFKDFPQKLEDAWDQSKRSRVWPSRANPNTP